MNDRYKKAVATNKKRHSKKQRQEWASKGGKATSSPIKGRSDLARAMAQKRWSKNEL